MPMAQGVLVVEPGDMQRRLLCALRNGNRQQARRIVMGSHARKAFCCAAMGLRPTFRRFVRHRLLSMGVDGLGLRPLLERLGPGGLAETLAAAAQWNIYIRHRFQAPVMLSIASLLGLARDCDGLVLDAPCGMGHLAFMISKLIDPQRIVCMDAASAFLYSTRRFFAPHAAAAVVHDMNNPLPLADKQFGAIFCVDAFHYIEQRAKLAGEFMRILRDDGVLVLVQVHNRLQHNTYAGHPLSPAEYAALFPGAHVRIFPETDLVRAYLDDRPLDLSRQIPEAELDRHRLLNVVATRSAARLAPLPSMRHALNAAARNPRLSELYRMRQAGGRVHFRRVLPDVLRSDFDSYPELLPPSHCIPSDQVLTAGARTTFADPMALLHRHVLVDLPDNY
jgi:SAM-dependent methyltransferase